MVWVEIVEGSAVAIQFGALSVDCFLFLGCGSYFWRMEVRVEWHSVVSTVEQLLNVYDALGGWEFSKDILNRVAHINIGSSAVLYLLDVAITSDMCQLSPQMWQMCFHSLPASIAIILFVALLDGSPDMLEGGILVNNENELLDVAFGHFGRPENPHCNAHRCRRRIRWTVVRLYRKIGGMERASGSDAHATLVWGRV
jgi:hypothetical protein